MARVVHISDLHFGRERSQLIDALMRQLTMIDPQLVIISGDLTQRATRREYDAAGNFIGGLSWPSLVIAGNHDIPAYNLRKRFFQPWKKWQQYIQKPLEPFVRGDDYVAIGLNTARRMGSWLDWSRGRVNIIQLGNVVRQLREETDDRLRIVVAHHPFWLPEAHRHRHVVGGAERGLKILAGAGVDMICSGHVHFPYTRIEKNILISHAGTAISTRLEDGCRNSFKVIYGDRRMVDIELQEWHGSTFVVRKRSRYRRLQKEWAEC